MSSAYRSLHINSARKLMSYKAFPMPEDYPDYPSHFQIAKYFDDYVEHFGLRERITFRTEVVVRRAGRRRVGGDASRAPTASGGPSATGRCWSPTATTGTRAGRSPPFPARRSSRASRSTSTTTASPTCCVGKRVLVLGIGNSAVDIAVESSRIAEKTFLAMRRGAYVMPKFLNGKPIDEAAPPLRRTLPLSVQRFFMARLLKLTVGDMTDYGLPKPDHKLLEAHPTVSSELLPRLGHGDIAVKPNIDRFAGGRTVRFADGSEEEIDLVVYCTGYKISFPFFDDRGLRGAGQPHAALPAGRSRSSTRPLLHRLHPAAGPDHADRRGAGRMGRRPAAGTARRCPQPSEMRSEIAAYEQRMRKRFVASKRHTIEVDFHPYLREIRRERKRSALSRPDGVWEGTGCRSRPPEPLRAAVAREVRDRTACGTPPPAPRRRRAGCVGRAVAGGWGASA